MSINVIKRAKEVLEIEAQAIKLLKGRLGKSFIKAIELILKCKDPLCRLKKVIQKRP